ncbi:hypothetical protein MPSEU_000003700 [Mayamaea pseudoterrestris]|nr:hypothetical protein MPSEU_000003700 [Mayamaea pseudoterrestris]
MDITSKSKSRAKKESHSATTAAQQRDNLAMNGSGMLGVSLRKRHTKTTADEEKENGALSLTGVTKTKDSKDASKKRVYKKRSQAAILEPQTLQKGKSTRSKQEPTIGAEVSPTEQHDDTDSEALDPMYTAKYPAYCWTAQIKSAMKTKASIKTMHRVQVDETRNQVHRPIISPLEKKDNYEHWVGNGKKGKARIVGAANIKPANERDWRVKELIPYRQELAAAFCNTNGLDLAKLTNDLRRGETLTHSMQLASTKEGYAKLAKGLKAKKKPAHVIVRDMKLKLSGFKLSKRASYQQIGLGIGILHEGRTLIPWEEGAVKLVCDAVCYLFFEYVKLDAHQQLAIDLVSFLEQGLNKAYAIDAQAYLQLIMESNIPANFAKIWAQENDSDASLAEQLWTSRSTTTVSKNDLDVRLGVSSV